jgi:hypothetical protein
MAAYFPAIPRETHRNAEKDATGAEKEAALKEARD